MTEPQREYLLERIAYLDGMCHGLRIRITELTDRLAAVENPQRKRQRAAVSAHAAGKVIFIKRG